MSSMTRVFVGLAALLVGCQVVPERQPLDAFPTAVDDTDLAARPNNCGQRSHPFDVQLTGYLPDNVLLREELVGFADYEFESVPFNLTSIILRVCEDGDEDQPSSVRTLALNFYGIARVDPGEYEVTRFAAEDGGFIAAYTDETEETVINCNDKPTGSVTIDESGFESISGSFDIDIRCINEQVLDRIPRDSNFSGTFSARNTGVE